MASYYYLISSLPMLKSDGSNTITFTTFLEQCKPNVSKAVYESLCSLSDPSNHHPMLKEWATFYNTLIDELTLQRKVKLEQPVDPSYSRDPELINTIAEVLAAKNPLVAEQMLLKLEFKRIDSMLGFHYFDEYFLYAYAIKLKLLERQDIFRHDEGKEEFKTLFTNLRSQILSM